MPPCMQPLDVGGFFQKGAPVDRPRADDGPDPSLRDDPGRSGAGCGVGEQKLNVLGARRLCVDKKAASLAALDLAGDLELVVVVELARCAAVAVVEPQCDLGQIACRPLVGAGKDDVVHLRSAHLAGVAFAHDPSKAFDDVRLAASVRPDDSGHAGFDLDLRRLGEGLETGHFQRSEDHGRLPAQVRKGLSDKSCAVGAQKLGELFVILVAGDGQIVIDDKGRG